MADEATPVELDVTDQSLFDSAIAPAEPEPAAEQDAPVIDANRDEKGRFAAKEEQPEAVADPVKEQDDDRQGHVPSWRVREINAEKAELAKKLETEQSERSRLSQQFEAMQREMQSLRKPAEQPKEQKPDPILDPEGYEKYIENKFEQRLLNERRDLSLQSAHRAHGKDFEEAYAAAQAALARGEPALTARLQQTRDPGEVLMEWHRQQKIMREVGNDPNVFFEKRLEAYLSDPANVAKVMEKARGIAQPTATGGRPNVQLPPSLSNMSPAAGSRGDDDTGDLSDEALFKQALR